MSTGLSKKEISEYHNVQIFVNAFALHRRPFSNVHQIEPVLWLAGLILNG
jgi:hypothetical protein